MRCGGVEPRIKEQREKNPTPIDNEETLKAGEQFPFQSTPSRAFEYARIVFAHSLRAELCATARGSFRQINIVCLDAGAGILDQKVPYRGFPTKESAQMPLNCTVSFVVNMRERVKSSKRSKPAPNDFAAVSWQT